MSGTVLSQTTELSVTEEELCTVVSSFAVSYTHLGFCRKSLAIAGNWCYNTSNLELVDKGVGVSPLLFVAWKGRWENEQTGRV